MEPHNVKQYWFVAIVTPNTICFMAYKVYKELERIIRIAKIDLSVDSVLRIAKNYCHSADKLTKQRNCNATDTAADP